MGTILESKLLAAFKFFDLNGDGTISRDDLAHICKELNPQACSEDVVDVALSSLDKSNSGNINYSEFATWVTSGVLDGRRVMGLYEEASLKLPGNQLGDGYQTDACFERIRAYLNNALDLKPEQFATPKATTKLTWLQDVATLLDPQQNPMGFHFCQQALLERDAIGVLLGLAQVAQSDAVVIKSLEVLARGAFGNAQCSCAILSHASFFDSLQSVFWSRNQPEKLAALQLAQALAVCSDPEVKQLLPRLAMQVSPMLADTCFAVLPTASFDVFVSLSFSIPDAIVNTLSWNQVASWVARTQESGRPVWLPGDSLTVLACGLMAVNVLGLPSAHGVDAPSDETEARKVLLDFLATSRFLEYFVLAVDAAAAQREWPLHSGVFHSIARLAPVVLKLSMLGFRRQLSETVRPLAKTVEINADEAVTKSALMALRALVDDLVCLETFLSLDEFRLETLELLHRAGDEPEATDLASCTCSGENALMAAHATLDASRHDLRNPPSVQHLAQLFNTCCSMDGELTKQQLLQILPKVPVGPHKDVEACLSAYAPSFKFSFGILAEHIYGTPTLLGWWPSLMEDASVTWVTDAALQGLDYTPSFEELLAYYELGAHGSSGLTSHAILHQVLPAWNLPVQGEVLEDLFAEIRGDDPLSLRDFAAWMSKYIVAAERLKTDAENAEGEEANPH